MPVDVEARVIRNVHLSRDYNVLALAAPEIAASAQPGQFVMVRPGRGAGPLLRRPFSVFEVLRDRTGHVTGVSILNKKAGRSTKKLYELEPGDVVSCLGPLGVPFKPVAAPVEAWMVAGGVGLAPRIYERAAELLERARTLIEGCPCGAGCPACVGPTEAQGTRKRLSLRLLSALSLRAASPRPPLVEAG